MSEKQTVSRNAYDHLTTLGASKPALMDCSHDLKLCRIQGQVFGAEATKRTDNPYPKGTAAHEWFDAGWIEEQEELCGDK